MNQFPPPGRSDIYRGKSVLLTGGAGFIGRKLTEHLQNLGAKVWVGCRSPVSRIENEKKLPPGSSVRILDLDLTYPEQVHAALEKAHPQVVFNLAARPAGDRSPSEMAAQVTSSVLGVAHLAEALLKTKNPFLVQLGSSEEYGRQQAPFHEELGAAPVSPYSAAKASCTLFLQMAQRAFGLPVVIARPSVVYGPGQGTGMVIPYLFECYINKKPAILTRGEQTRDFVFIDDCLAGLSLLGTRPELAGKIYNLGSGHSYPLASVAAQIARLCSYEGDLGLGKKPYRTADVMHHQEDCRKTEQELGWKALVSLEEGLRRTFDWWQTLAPR